MFNLYEQGISIFLKTVSHFLCEEKKSL